MAPTVEMLPHLKIASGSFIYYVINVYVVCTRVRANAYHMLTTPPRVFRDPKMCLRNIWTAPKLRQTSQAAFAASSFSSWFLQHPKGGPFGFAKTFFVVRFWGNF